jgi:hypothetical protein
MSESDLKEIVETGERLPREMFDPALLTEKDDMELPVFNGEKVVDQAGE